MPEQPKYNLMSSLLRRRYFMALCYLLVCVLGWIFWMRIPIELTPNTELPSVTVTYTWGSTSPEVMEQEITRRVEELANQLRGVSKIQSVTDQGVSNVTINFDKGTPIDYRIVELRELLNTLSQDLPNFVNQPVISKRVPKELQDSQTFITYSLSGSMNRYDLLDWAQKNIKLPLSGLNGLAGIDLNGIQDPALTITFKPAYVRQYNLSVAEIMSRIRTGMDWQTAGWTQSHGQRINIIRPPDYTSLDKIRALPIELPDSSGRIRLGQIASVSIQDSPAHSHTRIDGLPALTINFVKAAGADALTLAKTIHDRMQQIQQTLPPGTLLHLEYDSTKDLRQQIDSLSEQAWYSLLCVFIILLLFIREIRAPLLILSSILLSVLLSIGILYLAGYTLNLFTMAAITIALGMIVDNAIVVYEQIRPKLPRLRQERIGHVSRELRDVVVPVIGNTLTTVGIFIPLIFAMEKLRYFLVPLGLAMSLTLLASVLICLTWIPYALVWLIPSGQYDFPWLNTFRERMHRISTFVKRPFPSMNRILLVLFKWRYRLRWPVYIALILVIGIPLFLIPAPGENQSNTGNQSKTENSSGFLARITGFYFNNRSTIDPIIGGLSYRFYNNTYFGEPFTGSTNNVLSVNITTPLGTPLSELDKISRNFEKIAAPYRNAIDYFKTEESEGYGARIQYYFKKAYVDRPAPYLLKNDATYLAARTGNSSISVNGFGQGYYSGGVGSFSQFSYKLTGYSYQDLLDLAKELRRRLLKNRRVQNVKINGTNFYSTENLFQYSLHFNHDRMLMKNLDFWHVLQNLELEINPTYQFGRVYLNNRRLYLIGRIARPPRQDNRLMTEEREVNGVNFSLNQVASIAKERVMSDIRKENQAYSRYVSFDFIGPYKYGETFAKNTLKLLPVPIGAKVEFNQGFGFGNQQENQNLLFIILAAILVVWMIVSALLESWGEPLVIILAIPMSFIGIMAGVLYMNLDFDRGAFAGTLLLIGVVVNNAILLMHGRQLHARSGIHGARSWIYTYRNRMQSVLLTTLTTLAGLVPLMIQSSSEFWNTMAAVVFWGLSVSTVLIVLLIGMWEKPFGVREVKGAT